MRKSAISECATAVSLFRGLYGRVARNLGVDVSYVSRIARGERKSEAAEKALTREFNKAVSVMTNALVRSGKKLYIELVVQCPRCKTLQRIHVAAHPALGRTSGDRIGCINCNHHFKLLGVNKIIRGPFPA
jgi:phage FluMu protein Com